jgi:hypothetical protein
VLSSVPLAIPMSVAGVSVQKLLCEAYALHEPLIPADETSEKRARLVGWALIQ